MNTEDNIIGIVGGMGPMAGLALHQKIIQYSNAARDQDHSYVAHLSYSGCINDRTEFLEGRVMTNPAFNIVNVIEHLCNVGARFIGIPCNTSHAPEIFNVITEQVKAKELDVELKNMVSETISSVENFFPGANRIGLLTTNGTYKSKIYSDALEKAGFEIVVPDFEFQNNVIHEMIYNKDFGIKANFNIRERVYDLLDQAIQYFKENETDLIVLGCTEFSLIPKEKFKGVEVIDALDVLAKSLIKEVHCRLSFHQI